MFWQGIRIDQENKYEIGSRVLDDPTTPARKCIAFQWKQVVNYQPWKKLVCSCTPGWRGMILSPFTVMFD